MPDDQRATTTTQVSLPHVDWHLFSGAYACHALDEWEREAFEHHLATCVSCRDEVRSFQPVLVALNPPRQPPPALRRSVLAAIRMVRQVSPTVPPADR